jgi:hypothetical protein
MPLNILKLCVGCESIADLEGWIAMRRAEKRAEGQPLNHYHVTRMVPQRLAEILDGGSLYWIIKGNVQCREKIADIVPFTDDEGIGRCRIVFEEGVIPTHWQPRRPFQGWRYLKPEDAPRDLGASASEFAEMPDHMRRELSALGLL